MSLKQLLASKASAAMVSAGLPEDCAPHLNPSNKPGFGDFQINGAMGAAKRLKSNPREIAGKIIEHLDLEGICSKIEIAGPGFINLTLDDKWLSNYLQSISESDKLGVDVIESPDTVVVDYSSPNVAKEMHVGHIRGTVLGDAVVRVLEFLGHKVIRQNHIGDWGTQFGMLITELSQQLESGTNAEMELEDLEQFYRQAKVHFDEEPGFADKARENVVKLQAGDEQCIALWRKFIEISLSHAAEIYEKLNVTLKPEDVYGESAYNDDLANLVNELRERSLAVEDQGAQVVFLDELADKNGNPSPFIVQKAGGGFLYSTSDLAAVRYRTRTLKANRCLYFIDARQSLHMKQVYATARKAKWVSDDVELLHCSYGTIMGDDGKPFKTRSGDSIKLNDLLDEAIERASKIVAEKNAGLSESEQHEVAKAIGIGAVKYADLSKTRTNDYVFNWDSMLSLEGNTAPYLQYAFTRIQSIFRKAEVEPDQLINFAFDINQPEERALALMISQFPDVVTQVGEKALPHELCNYVYELAGRFMTFYEACPILKDSVDQSAREARLKLAYLTSTVIKQGLELLGISTVDRM